MLRLGDRLGPYTLLRVLGEGAMGQVFEASNAQGMRVAIKVIHPHLVHNADFRERFLREVRVLRRLLATPGLGIADLIDQGEEQVRGLPYLYFVMECLQGDTLGARIRKGTLPLAKALKILIPVVETVGRAHHQGIFHRDLKPDNIFLAVTNHGVRSKVLDFGIARLLHDPQLQTRVGEIFGTIQYMSAHHLEDASKVDAMDDVWALIAIFYEMLVGQPAYPLDLQGGVAGIYPVVQSRLTLPPYNPLIDPRAWRVIERGLSNDRARQYVSAGELLHDLRQLTPQQIPPPTVASTAPAVPPTVRASTSPPSPGGVPPTANMSTPPSPPAGRTMAAPTVSAPPPAAAPRPAPALSAPSSQESYDWWEGNAQLIGMKVVLTYALVFFFIIACFVGMDRDTKWPWSSSPSPSYPSSSPVAAPAPDAEVPRDAAPVDDPSPPSDTTRRRSRHRRRNTASSSSSSCDPPVAEDGTGDPTRHVLVTNWHCLSEARQREMCSYLRRQYPADKDRLVCHGGAIPNQCAPYLGLDCTPSPGRPVGVYRAPYEVCDEPITGLSNRDIEDRILTRWGCMPDYRKREFCNTLRPVRTRFPLRPESERIYTNCNMVGVSLPQYRVTVVR